MSWLRDAIDTFTGDEIVRSQEISELAHRLKMEYIASETIDTLPYLKTFRIGKYGSNRKIKNVLHFRDEWGRREFRIFDYHYTIHAGNSHRTYRQTLFFVNSKELALPEFMMKPEKFFHKIGAYLGFRDINFELHPKFSGRYHLKGPVEEHIRGLMTPNVLHYFSINEGWTLEGINYFLVLYQPNQLIQPSWVERFYVKGREIYDMLVSEQPGMDLPDDHKPE